MWWKTMAQEQKGLFLMRPFQAIDQVFDWTSSIYDIVQGVYFLMQHMLPIESKMQFEAVKLY